MTYESYTINFGPCELTTKLLMKRSKFFLKRLSSRQCFIDNTTASPDISHDLYKTLFAWLIVEVHKYHNLNILLTETITINQCPIVNSNHNPRYNVSDKLLRTLQNH